MLSIFVPTIITKPLTLLLDTRYEVVSYFQLSILTSHYYSCYYLYFYLMGLYIDLSHLKKNLYLEKFNLVLRKKW